MQDFLYVIDIYSKYSWIFPLKDNKNITIAGAFLETLDDFGCKDVEQSTVDIT